MCIGALITPFVKNYLAQETLLYLTFFYIAYIPLNTYRVYHIEMDETKWL